MEFINFLKEHNVDLSNVKVIPLNSLEMPNGVGQNLKNSCFRTPVSFFLVHKSDKLLLVALYFFLSFFVSTNWQRELA